MSTALKPKLLLLALVYQAVLGSHIGVFRGQEEKVAIVKLTSLRLSLVRVVTGFVVADVAVFLDSELLTPINWLTCLAHLQELQ